MTTREEFETFVNQLRRDAGRLDKQYQAFHELQQTLKELKAASPHDKEAARRLEKVNALYQDENFLAIYAQAERDLKVLNAQMEQFNKQIAQADKSQTVPAAQPPQSVEKMKTKTGARKRQFV